MSKWRARWLVRIRRARAGSWPDTDVRERMADTPGELRAIIEAARADPAVLAFPYERRRDLVGAKPQECGRGHGLDRAGWGYAGLVWGVCCCGGHEIVVCQFRVGGVVCGDEVIDPPVSYDCDVVWPRK